jgi:hypothetical protein
MNTFLSIIALVLLAVLSWIFAYTVCLTILRRSQWSPRFHLEQRFPPQRFRKINRTTSAVIALIVAGIVMYYTAPATIQSLRPASPPNDVLHETTAVPPARR